MKHSETEELDDSFDTPLAREAAQRSKRRKDLAEVSLQFPQQTRVITIANQKGGVGKTTTTVNLAAALVSWGARVLVIDLDPQGNTSTALGIPHSADVSSIYEVLCEDVPLADVVQTSPESDSLLCAPSTIHLAGAEIELVGLEEREFRLKKALAQYLRTNPHVDFVLIDCPPSLGLLTINAFSGAGEVLIPIQCEYYALEGLSQLLGSVELIKKHLNQSLEVSTILLTMYDGRTRLAQQVAEEVREHFKDVVLETVIPRSVRISEAPSFGQSILAYDPGSIGALAYRAAAVEVANRSK